MDLKELVNEWFTKWESGDFPNIPIEEDFQHISPFGTIDGKKAYLDMVEANRDAFLGGKFKRHDEIYSGDRACVRYTMHSGSNEMEVSEWFFMGDQKIRQIVSYYNVGKVSYSANMNQPE